MLPENNPKTVLLQRVVNKCFGTTLRLNISLKSLKGQCVGIEAVQVLVNITSPLQMRDDIFVHAIIVPTK